MNQSKLHPCRFCRNKLANAWATVFGRRPPRATAEGQRAAEPWTKLDPEILDQHRVIGYQNPRINPQSIITRHMLIRELFGAHFDTLMGDELEFCAEAVEALRRRSIEIGVEMKIPLNARLCSSVRDVGTAIAHWERTYEQIWAGSLASRKCVSLKVLELACGSANDYRFFDSYGIANFLDYTGVDLVAANIENARKRFPAVDFRTADILNLSFKPKSFEVVIASNIVEYLPLQLVPRVLHTAAVLARRSLVVNFFNMANIPAHQEVQRSGHFRNQLSKGQVLDTLKKYGDVEAINTKSLLVERCGYKRWYNSKAWTVAVDLKQS